MSSSLTQAIRNYRVERGSVALWWLGQMGYLIKTPSDAVFAVDAYLTDSCGAIGEAMGLNFHRQVPVFIEPEELDVDYVLCTHNHQDHADPETITRMPKTGVSEFVGPGMACETFRSCGVDAHKTHGLYAGGKRQLADVTVHGAFALPTDTSDVNHLGFVLAVDDGPRVYISGDTDYSDILGHVAALRPNVMITCMNGGFNNMSQWEAADVAHMIKPEIAIPCHYDMFPDNSADPEQFRACLRRKAPDVRYRRLEHVKPFVYRGS